MLCLGRHWNGKTYQYEPTRSDFDGLPAPPLPEAFKSLARRDRRVSGHDLEADLCILNYYQADGRMGLHRTRTRAAIDRRRRAGRVGVARRHGAISVRRIEAARRGGRAMLESGDAFVFGGRRGCATTASRASSLGPPRPSSL